ncbi:MAG TPA: NnrU family protein [Burkholderiaceae bacterium]|nr:NnrU family protein [Burkholderiaceae bacterium]
MTYLALGLLLFLGIHSVRIFAEDWRQKRLDTLGEAAWKGTYSLISVAGFALIVWGYGVARQAPVVLWVPPVGQRHAASLLTLVSFVLLAATYVPANALKARLKHPMVLGIKLWALAHLLSNGNLADVLLFGSFLLWAILSFRAARLRDAAAVVKAEITHSPASRTILTLVLGVVAWAAFALWAHGPLIGVSPFGG